MSQDIDLSDDSLPEYAQKDNLVSEDINACSCESAPVRMACSVSDEHNCVEGSNDTCRSPVYANEVSAAFESMVIFQFSI